MKAYYLYVKDNEDQGCYLVWDTTYKNARKRINESDLVYDSYIEVRCKRYPQFDGLEGLSKRELALKKWQESWWFDNDEPTFDDYEENTDQDFLDWYDKRHPNEDTPNGKETTP